MMLVWMQTFWRSWKVFFMFNFRKAITMNKFESTINGGSLARVGIILALCGAASWFVQARNATPTATANSSTSVESAPVELLPGATIWVDTVIGQVPLTIVSIANGQATLTDADGDEHVMSANALAWGSMVDDIDQADEQAALHLAAVERRRASGYYEAHAPAGWCNAADCPPTQTPARVTNYAPEHWTPEARAALQYPAARAAQQWANEHLYNR
jgi:hypothetical protein